MFSQFHVDENEKEFCQRSMNKNIEKEVEKIKRATFSDGLGKQDTTKSIITI